MTSAAEQRKRCSRCEAVKPLAEFNRDGTKRDGRTSRCKKCSRAAARQWERDHPERVAASRRRNAPKIRARVRRWKKKNPEKRAAANRRERERNPIKSKARAAVQNAVAGGKLAKPDRCEDCGEQFEKRQLHGHHRDYSKPLDVEWLCQDCHNARHFEVVA